MFPPTDDFAYTVGALTPQGGWTTDSGAVGGSLIVAGGGLVRNVNNIPVGNIHTVAPYVMPPGGGWTIEVTFRFDTALPTNVSFGVHLANDTGVCVLGIEREAFQSEVTVAAFCGAGDFEVNNVAVGTNVDIRLTLHVAADGTGTLFKDGVSIGSGPNFGITGSDFDRFYVNMVESDTTARTHIKQVHIAVDP